MENDSMSGGYDLVGRTFLVAIAIVAIAVGFAFATVLYNW
jgi:hypothetical protein